MLVIEGHSFIFPRTVHWNAGTLGASSTIFFPQWNKSTRIVFLVPIPQSCAGFSDLHYLPRLLLSAKICTLSRNYAFCFNQPRVSGAILVSGATQLLWSTQTAIICAGFWVLHLLLQALHQLWSVWKGAICTEQLQSMPALGSHLTVGGHEIAGEIAENPAAVGGDAGDFVNSWRWRGFWESPVPPLHLSCPWAFQLCQIPPNYVKFWGKQDKNRFLWKVSQKADDIGFTPYALLSSERKWRNNSISLGTELCWLGGGGVIGKIKLQFLFIST